jgi:hypothetical protein
VGSKIRGVAELRKTGANQYDVVADEQVIGQVWNWHGSGWSVQAGGKTHHGLKSRKEAIVRVEHIHRLRA